MHVLLQRWKRTVLTESFCFFYHWTGCFLPQSLVGLHSLVTRQTDALIASRFRKLNPHDSPKHDRNVHRCIASHDARRPDLLDSRLVGYCRGSSF